MKNTKIYVTGRINGSHFACCAIADKQILPVCSTFLNLNSVQPSNPNNPETDVSFMLWFTSETR